jgi:hypothetical protein
LIGTAAMAPASMGGKCSICHVMKDAPPTLQSGVVDASLRVHGIRNLRVVDASIFPNHISAHTQATVYAVAEAVSSHIARFLNSADC